MTAPLIPLYAVGVFLAFTLSQTGMVVHWWRLRDRHWRKSLIFNAVGALLSATVLVTAAITKFTSGAWFAALVVGLFILVATRIRHHYEQVAAALALHPHAVEVPGRALTRPRPRDGAPAPSAEAEAECEREAESEETPEEIHPLLIVPIAALDLAGMRALAYAASLRQPVLALHISASEEEARRFRAYWNLWGDHLPLKILLSPYRTIVAPLVNYIEALHGQRPDLTLTVVLPEIVVRHRRHRLLHNRLAPACAGRSAHCRRSSSPPSRSTSEDCPACPHPDRYAPAGQEAARLRATSARRPASPAPVAGTTAEGRTSVPGSGPAAPRAAPRRAVRSRSGCRRGRPPGPSAARR